MNNVRRNVLMMLDQNWQRQLPYTEYFFAGSQHGFPVEICKKDKQQILISTVTGGGSVLRNNYNRDETRADSLTYPGVYSLANTAGPLVTMPYKSKYAINSFYGLVYRCVIKTICFLILPPARTGTVFWQHHCVQNNAGFFYPSANLSFVLSDAVQLPRDDQFCQVQVFCIRV